MALTYIKVIFSNVKVHHGESPENAYLKVKRSLGNFPLHIQDFYIEESTPNSLKEVKVISYISLKKDVEIEDVEKCFQNVSHFRPYEFQKEEDT